MVGECWLQSARVARKAGHHQTAYNALLNAGESRLAELYVERAKWLWSKVLAKGTSSENVLLELHTSINVQLGKS